MVRINFSISIDAAPEVVWGVILGNLTQQKWSSTFRPITLSKSDLKEGELIRCMCPEGNGMISRILKLTPNRQLVLMHLSEIKERVEQPIKNDSSSWSGTKLSVQLKTKVGLTVLEVEIDTVIEVYQMVNECIPKSLEMIKLLSENELTREAS